MSGSSSNLSLNATNQQNIVLNQQNLINRGNIIVNQTQNTQNLILNQTNIMQNSQNIILNHPSSQNIVLSQNNLISRPSNVQSQKQSPIHPSPCQSPYQIFNTNATMVGSNNLSLISNFPTSSANFASNFHHQSNVLQTSNVNACLQTKNVSPSLNIVSNVSANIQSNISSNLVSNQSISTQIGTKINQNMTLTSNNLSAGNNTPSNFSSNYSNPSPISNPINSPYSNQILSPSNSVSSVSNLKSPVQSPSPILRPTTPQPIIQQTFQQIPVMTSGPNQLVQIIQTPNNGSPYQNQILGRQQIIAPTTHIQTNSTSIMKIKQPLNILPKPPTAVNSSGGAKANRNNHTQAVQQQNNAPQIMLPNQAILPQAQTGTLVLNQMPLLVQQNTPQGIQLVLRPGTPNNPQISNQRTTQNLILQQNNSSQPTVLIQHNSRPTIQQQPQQLVRVLTANGLVQQLATPTFIAMNGQPLNLQQLSQQKTTGPHIITNQTQQNINIQTQNMSALSACIPNLNQITQQLVQSQQQQISVNNNNVTNVIQQNQQHITAVNTLNVSQPTHNSNLANNALSTNATQIINAVATNTTNVANAIQANISVLSSGNNTSNHLSNLTIHTSNETNAIPSSVTTTMGQVSVNTTEENALPPPKKKPKKKKKNKETKLDLANLMKLSGIGDDDDVYLESDVDMTSANNTNSTVTITEQKPYQTQSVSPAPKTPSPCIITTPKQSPQTTQIIDHNQSNQQITLSQNMIQKLQSISQEYSLSQNDLTSLMSFPSQIGSIQISAISDSNINNKTIQKPQIIVQSNNHNTAMLQQQQITQQQSFNNSRNVNNSTNQVQNLNIPTQIGNIQISQICSPSNSSANTLQNNTVVNSNVLQHNQGGIIVQQNVQNVHSAQTTGGGTPHAPLGGFKLTMTEDGRILLQHDPTMHQDLQSQMLLQQIFGLNIVQPTVQPNIVFTSNPGVSLPSNIATQSQLSTINTQQQKPIDNMQQNKFNNSTIIAGNTTKTINSIQQTVATPKIENNSQLLFNEPLVLAPSNINGQIMLSLSADQLEQLKNNPQFSINGPTLVLNNAGNITQQTINQKPPMTQNINVNNVANKAPSSVLVQHLNSKTPLKTANENIYPNATKQNVISPPKSVGKVVKKSTKNTTTMANNMRNVKTVKSTAQEQVKVSTVTTSSGNVHLSQPNMVSGQLGHNVIMSNSASQTNCIQIGSSIATSTQSLVTTTNVSPICSITQNSANNLQNVTIQNSMPPLIAVSIQKSVENTIQAAPTMTMTGLNMPQLVPLPNTNLQVSTPNTTAPQMYQRVQTIQLTPQKQQQLKSIQLQIQALSARLQNKTLSENINKSTDNKNENSNVMTDSEIQTALQRLFHEQQKILATGKLLSILPGQAIPNFSNANVITSEGIQLSTGNAVPKNSSIQFNSNFVQSSPTVKTSCQTVQATQTAPKVYYHHMGNQVMQINQNACAQLSTSGPTSIQNQVTMATGTTTVSSATNTEKIVSTTSSIGNFVSPNKITPIVIQTQMPEKSTQASTSTEQPTKFSSPTTSNILPPSNNITPTLITPKPNLISPNSRAVKRPPLAAPTRPAIPRSVLIEHQLNTDQTEAANPDIHTPFGSKADACKRLVRYHCFNQPVLSQKDLDKADEIFEMTARHFIDKFYNMVNKYKSLRLMESMREVPTSELMMIDRMFIAGEQQELDKLRAEKLQWDLEGNGCDISIASLIKHENIMAQHSQINMQSPQSSDYKMHSKTDIFDVKQADLMKQEIDPKIKSEANDNTEYDEWLCIQKELGYVADKTVKTTMSPSSTTGTTTAMLGVSKTEIKVENDFDMETNIKAFEIRPNETKRTLPDLDQFSESAKRICTHETRNEKIVKGSDMKRMEQADMTPIKDQLNDLNDKCLTSMDLISQGFTHGEDSVATNKAIEVRATVAAMETSTNYKPVNNESEVFRTQNSYKKTFVSVSNNLTSHSISNSVSQPKIGIGGGGSSTNIVSQTDIDLELELGIDQFSLLKSNNLDSLDIDAQVQSAIDSILNLQQTQDGSINMNTILSNASNQHGANVDDVDKSAQFINDLLGVSSTVPASNSIRKIDCAKRGRVDGKPDQLYDDLTSADKSIYKMVAKTDMDSFSECSSPDDALDQAVRSILS